MRRKTAAGSQNNRKYLDCNQIELIELIQVRRFIYWQMMKTFVGSPKKIENQY